MVDEDVEGFFAAQGAHLGVEYVAGVEVEGAGGGGYVG